MAKVQKALKHDFRKKKAVENTSNVFIRWVNL